MMVAQAGTSQAKTPQFTTNAFWQVKKNKILKQHTFLLINYTVEISAYVVTYSSTVLLFPVDLMQHHAYMLIRLLSPSSRIYTQASLD